MSKAYHIGRDQNSGIEWILCHRCGCRSYNQNDIDNHYCNGCHMFLDGPDAASQEIGRVGELVGGGADAIAGKAMSDFMDLADKVAKLAEAVIADCTAARERCVSHFNDQIATLTALSNGVHEEAEMVMKEMATQGAVLRVKIAEFTDMSKGVAEKMRDLRAIVAGSG